MRHFLLGFFACYFVTGLAAGLAMKRVIPPLNGFGVAYVGATYPVSLVCIAAHSMCTPVPTPETAKWMFTFPKDASQ